MLQWNKLEKIKSPIEEILSGFFYLLNKYYVIFACPNCGFFSENCLKNGVSCCSNCCYLIDCGQFNKLLAASWIVRRKKISAEQLQSWLGLSDEEAQFVYHYVEESCYSHDEFLKILKKAISSASWTF